MGPGRWIAASPIGGQKGAGPREIKMALPAASARLHFQPVSAPKGVAASTAGVGCAAR